MSPSFDQLDRSGIHVVLVQFYLRGENYILSFFYVKLKLYP